ncbi:MAG: hypothetical protein A3G18_00820 [Rhodospirillales bacterium RIFCSPLOWO2_12_FULL_58_28]|nr:MAG: hypothetical protein A3H92_12665 [Rhodospirillales bacterium RIFCSPLOWO2_02_FULL_58_16]OHC77065.1 MAG: hypothetical protein A3G18_00820 [Rhodospirillales bacterium RIFCSPLOWO2_12_FULL_58_28]
MIPDLPDEVQRINIVRQIPCGACDDPCYMRYPRRAERRAGGMRSIGGGGNELGDGAPQGVSGYAN